MKMSKYLSDKYKDLLPYVPGEQPKDKQYVKLNTNESPFAPSLSAVTNATEQLSKSNLYPDPDLKELTFTVAEYLGVKSNQVLMTNGSDEILNFAFMAFCDSNTPAIFPDISYGFYKVFAQINGVPYREIPLKEDFSIGIEDYFGVGGTIFIANPNAPTGIALSIGEVEKIVKNNPKNVVVIDQAYVDFGGESAVSLVDKYDNLLVTETFSKSRSMAGARLGYGVGQESLIRDLNAIKYSLNPYNVNRATAALGIGSIKDDQYFKGNIEKIIQNRAYTINELSKLGFSLTDSKANFVFAKNDKIEGKTLYLKLKEKGILVRHFEKQRIKDYNRITIGSLSEMESLIQAVKQILKEIENEKSGN